MSVDFLKQTFGRTFTGNNTGAKTATRVYYIKLSAGVDDLSVVLSDAIGAGLPDLGDAFGALPNEAGLVVTSHEPKEIDKERGFYSIQVNYQTYEFSMATPTQRPWSITFSSDRVEIVPAVTLWNTGAITPVAPVTAVGIGEPILNTAGDPFDPPVTSFRVRPIITLQKNFAAITDIGSITTIAQLMSYVGKLNSLSVTVAGITADVGQFLMDDINCVYTSSDGQEYYNTTFRIIFDDQYHVAQILNAGYNDTAGAINVLGVSVSSPQLLDAAGARITGTPAAKAAAAIYLAFGVQDIIAFSTLGLPTTF